MKAKEHQQDAKGYNAEPRVKAHPERRLGWRGAIIGVWAVVGRKSDLWFVLSHSSLHFPRKIAQV